MDSGAGAAGAVAARFSAAVDSESPGAPGCQSGFASWAAAASLRHTGSQSPWRPLREKGGGQGARAGVRDVLWRGLEVLEGWERRGTQTRASSSPLLHAGVKSRQRPTQAAVLQVQSDTPVLDSVKRTLWLCVAASSGVRRAGRPCPTFPLLPNSADVHKDCNTQIRQK